jgi:hypothetical protein
MQMNGSVRFATKKGVHFIHRTAGCVGRRVGPDAAVQGILTAAGSRRPVVQPVATVLIEMSRHTVQNRQRFEICALLGYYTAFSCNYSPTFRVDLFKGQEVLTLED